MYLQCEAIGVIVERADQMTSSNVLLKRGHTHDCHSGDTKRHQSFRHVDFVCDLTVTNRIQTFSVYPTTFYHCLD